MRCSGSHTDSLPRSSAGIVTCGKNLALQAPSAMPYFIVATSCDPPFLGVSVLASGREVAAVDVDRRSGDEPTEVARQIEARGRDVVGMTGDGQRGAHLHRAADARCGD